jgi:hypothetical protein
MVKSAIFDLLSLPSVEEMQGAPEIHRRPMNFVSGVHLHNRERF